MTTFDNDLGPKKPIKFVCELCHFKCCYNRDFKRHIETIKHKNNVFTTENNKFLPILPKLEKKYNCDICDKEYTDRAGLWRHKKKCIKYNDISKNINTTENGIDNNLIVMLLNQNNQLQQQIIELCKNSNNNINSNNINSNNKSFNLNLFLNETCKNAMNIMDFANSIQLNLTDLEQVGELGYVEGISKIIIDNLKLLDVTERPVHCSDLKRDVLYIKDNDKWEKENDNRTNIKKIINCVTNKNISLIPEWKQKYPECNNSNSSKSTKINKMIMEVMETDFTKNEKIIKNIAKEVTINKY